MHSYLAIPPIPVGQHVTVSAGGFTFDLDTIWTTAIACLTVVALGLYLRRRATSGVPGKAQLVWEVVVTAVGNQVESALGPRYRHVVPVAVTIFFLVLACDWIELLPGFFHSTDYLPSPSADVNMTYALAVSVLVMTTAAGIRAKGFGGWVKSFFTKPVFLAPIRVLESLVTNPLSLALRLFGNIFAGGILVALLLTIPIYGAVVSVPLTVIWKVFDMFIGALQAFIFALLTILYWQFSVSSEH
ncbi:MAG TPA: F0F1 ATP synthase subunit A [Acidimicrobiales bacterium]|nr:F0F1 ATP synthase subunit A [Acidimicrobiales bacterium]